MNYSFNPNQQFYAPDFPRNNPYFRSDNRPNVPPSSQNLIQCNICSAAILRELVFTNMNCSHNYCLYCVQEFHQAQIYLSECYSEHCPFNLNQTELVVFINKARDYECNLSKHKDLRNLFERNTACNPLFSNDFGKRSYTKQNPRQIFQIIDEYADNNCSICLESLSSQMALHLLKCRDVFHIDCLENYLVEQINQRRFPIKCPNPNCRKEIDSNDVYDSLQTQLIYQQKYDEYSLQSYLDSHPDQYIHCLTPNCPMTFVRDYSAERLNCPNCSKCYCLQCEAEYHEDMSCSEFAESKCNQTDEFFLDFAAKKDYKRCPQCRIFVERAEGCMHMQCTRCHTEFCYRCGQRRNGSCKCE